MRPTGALPSLSGSIASEKALVEVPAIGLLQSLGWQHGDLMQEEPGAKNPTGRLSFVEVILPARLRAALRRLNPALSEEALREAEAVLTADRSAMLPLAANREVYGLLRNGVPIEVRQPDGSSKPERVALIDWTNPAGHGRLRQRHSPPARRVEGAHTACSGSLRGQPAGLPRYHPAAIRLQRLYDPF
jgi:type I restriction enzyme R subunit